MSTPFLRLSALAAALVATLSGAACDLDLGGSSHRADTHTSRPDTSVGDTVDAGGDLGADTSEPDAWSPPGVIEFRIRPKPWSRTAYASPDGESLLVPVEAAGSTPTQRKVVIARVDAETLAVTPGPEVTPHGRPIDIFTSADPEVAWVVDYEARWLAPLAIDSLELGYELALPAAVDLKNASWAIDGKAVAFAHRDGGAGDDAPWTGVFTLALPEDALALEATAEMRSVTIGESHYLRMRVTSTGFLLVSGAPKAPSDPNCLFCFEEPDYTRAFFHVYRLADDEDPREPRLAESVYDDSFRVTPEGRWLLRQDSEGKVTATELGETMGEPRATPCRGVGLMELAPDGRIICSGASTFRPGEPSVFHLDPDLATLDEVDVPAPIIIDLATSPDYLRVWAQGAMVDLTVDPAKVTPIDLDYTSAVPGIADVWLYTAREYLNVRRVGWDDPTLSTTTLPADDIVQLEPLADGVAVVRGASPDTITIHDRTGRERGRVQRRLP
ncbi:MAG: hypothetical protein IT385_08965 [Deltaproteobacteria bacterium]|nr:hypothetical protein [Deltaproteobacteria bacterium]